MKIENIPDSSKFYIKIFQKKIKEKEQLLSPLYEQYSRAVETRDVKKRRAFILQN